MPTKRSVALLLSTCSLLSAPLRAAEKITYDDHIFPIFESSCLNCHNPDKKKGDPAARAAVRKQAAGQALGVFCQGLLASNQFLYID